MREKVGKVCPESEGWLQELGTSRVETSRFRGRPLSSDPGQPLFEERQADSRELWADQDGWGAAAGGGQPINRWVALTLW